MNNLTRDFQLVNDSPFLIRDHEIRMYILFTTIIGVFSSPLFIYSY